MTPVLKDDVLIAEGYEVSLERAYQDAKWLERQFIVRSVAYLL